MKRTLRLNRETLTDLHSDELRSVAGGTHAACVTHGNTSCDACPTVPFNECFVIVSLGTCITTTRLCPTTPAGGAL